tara:strand:+ start:1581 stop:2285 length:705 start_codon:yes stop_codon:yes gene_type:complete
MTIEWTIKSASNHIGGLSTPSKMPSFGTSLPAKHCKVGSKLNEVEGTTCSGCYALKGAYAWGNVQDALERRFNILMECEHDESARSNWVGAFAFLLNTRHALQSKRKKKGAVDHAFFRWHDSGDVQGLFHLEMIAEVAMSTPNVQHWLPTRELAMVKQYIAKHGSFPSNLTVRLSAAKVNTAAPSIDGTVGSSVHTGDITWGAQSCIAYQQEGECRDCRACWDPNVKEISYPKH